MFRLKVNNFRALRKLDFSPSGVCLLVGANGTGKTTVLRLLQFLYSATHHNIANGLHSIGALIGLRSMAANPDELVTIESSFGDVTWHIDIKVNEDGYYLASSETVTKEGKVLANRNMGESVTHLCGQSSIYGESEGADSCSALKLSALKLIKDVEDPYGVSPLLDVLYNICVTHSHSAFTVLKHWQDYCDPRFTQVMEDLGSMFSKDIHGLELHTLQFKPEVATSRWGAQGYSICSQDMSEGFVAALTHLCAAANTERNGILAIDRIEDKLHPAIIVDLVRALRRWAKKRQLTIVLTTHSPYVLNLFEDNPDQIYVMDPQAPAMPMRLTDLHDPAWLKHFRIGDLYGVEFAR